MFREVSCGVMLVFAECDAMVVLRGAFEKDAFCEGLTTDRS